MITVPDEIKALFHLDHCYKNIRIHFPGGERSDICNDLIVKDTVLFKESLCSQSEFKFGLCEAPVFECETVGVGNITGATIEVTCEIECPATVTGAEWKVDLQKYVYPISYGTFIVSDAKRQADMIHRKIQAYGGRAAKNWVLMRQETRKLNANGAAYTPVIPFFLASNDIYFFDNIMDEVPNSWTGDAAGTIIGNSLIIGREESPLGGYYTYSVSLQIVSGKYKKWGSGYDTNYNYLYRIDADFASDKEQLKAELSKLIKRWGSASDEDINRIAGNAFLGRLYYVNSSGWGYEIFGGEGGLSNKYIYPFFNGQYASNMAGTTYTRPEVVVVKIGKKYSAPQSETTWVDSIEFRVLTEPPTIYRQSIKNSAQALGLTAQFETIKDNDYPIYTPEFSGLDLVSLANSFVELQGGFGYFDRMGASKFINIKRQFGLVPSGSLYPESGLYPQSVTGGKLLPRDYRSCWYDDNYEKPFGAIECEYKNTENESISMTFYLPGYDRNSDVDTYKVYSISQNELISSAVWTAEQIQSICQFIADNIGGVSYMPVDFVGRGLPYVEAGDTFEILTKSNDSITTIVLDRTIAGEMTLEDSYKSV